MDEPNTHVGFPYDSPPVHSSEILALIGIVVLTDVALYRGGGYAGVAVFCAGMCVLLLLGAAVRKISSDLLVVAVLLAGIVIRLIWCGDGLSTLWGLALIGACSMTLAGRRPFVMKFIAFLGQLIPSMVRGLFIYGVAAVGVNAPTGLRRLPGAAVVLPAGALIGFGSLFLLANPDVIQWFGDQFKNISLALRDWFDLFSLAEVSIWLIAAGLGVGLLRPTAAVQSEEESRSEEQGAPAAEPLGDSLYEGFRNTLVVVVALFTVYLAFEFRTLWFRKLPEGFSYHGYAHQGAFWLTVALALATGILCVIFRGPTLVDARLPFLRRLGLLWATQNLLLALCVYNRLWLYVDYNGMTRMRTVGFLGITAVVGGSLLVLWKISRNRNSTWLFRRQLWVLAFAAYVYAAAPIDRWVTQYNVSRVLQGKSAPEVYRLDETESVEGLMMLEPLLNSSNPTYQAGARVRLLDELAMRTSQEYSPHWSRFQIAEKQFRQQLQRLVPTLQRR
jgi:hypothetical protein